MNKHCIIVLTGPTAVGKTSVAVRIAHSVQTVVISSDSRQFYREMPVGTASPSVIEKEGVIHYFIGHLSVSDYYNVSKYEQDVLKLLSQLFQEQKIVILTGGSGLYINAVCNGIDELPDPDEVLRKELKRVLAEKGISSLQEKLQELDPVYYQQVDKDNPNRLLRAVEVCIQTGAPYSSLRNNKTKKRDFDIVKIGLFRDRAELNERINSRVDTMIEQGLENEVRSLIAFRDLNALNTVGYNEIFSYFDGKITFDQAVIDIKTNSRRYAKRQMTWFRKDTEINWFHSDDQLGLDVFINALKTKYL